MKKLTEYTFKGEPNQYVNVVGSDVGFRFDDKGLLFVMSNNPYVNRLKRKFEYTEKGYKLTEIKPKEAPVKKEVKPKEGE